MTTAHVNSRRQRFMAAGLCRDCGLIPPSDGYKNCIVCREQRKDYQVKRAARLRASVRCHDCSGPSREGKLLCADCSYKRVHRMRLVRRSNKDVIINHFGGCCADCGEKDIRCLAIHHKNGDGVTECKRGRGRNNQLYNPTWYARLRKQIDNGDKREDLMLVCHNCHAKRDLKPWWWEDADNT